jgi:hypothetical protein
LTIVFFTVLCGLLGFGTTLGAGFAAGFAAGFGLGLALGAGAALGVGSVLIVSSGAAAGVSDAGPDVGLFSSIVTPSYSPLEGNVLPSIYIILVQFSRGIIKTCVETFKKFIF